MKRSISIILIVVALFFATACNSNLRGTWISLDDGQEFVVTKDRFIIIQNNESYEYTTEDDKIILVDAWGDTIIMTYEVNKKELILDSNLVLIKSE